MASHKELVSRFCLEHALLECRKWQVFGTQMEIGSPHRLGSLLDSLEGISMQATALNLKVGTKFYSFGNFYTEIVHWITVLLLKQGFRS